MNGRLISDKARSWLLAELDLWCAQGILSQEQARRIRDLYESTTEVSERKRSRGIFALLGVAAFLVGLAALLVIGYNWEAMPRGLKLATVLAAILGTHAFGFYLRYRQHARTSSEIVFFLGCLFYGAGIWLVAQVFHISAHYPDGVWWWAVGVLPFALCFDTLLLHGLLVALLGVWAGLEVLNFGHLGSWIFGRWESLPNGAYSLAVLALPGFIWAYRRASVVTVGLYVPLLAWWVILQPFAWQGGGSPIYFIGSAGAWLLILAEAHRPGSLYAIPYRLYGVLLSAGVLTVLSFYGFYRGMGRAGAPRGGLRETLAIAVVSLATIAVTALARSQHAEHGRLTVLIREILRRQWYPAALVLCMAFSAVWHSLFRTGETVTWQAALPPTVLANLAMIAGAIWLMRIGLREDRGRPFAAGVLLFLLWAVLRYIDLFGDFGGMLGAALMFFLCGAALSGLALYWRRRREVRHA